MHIHPDIAIFAILLLVIFGFTARVISARRRGIQADHRWMEMIKYLGQISLALGVILQALELTHALDALEIGGGTIAADKIAGGLKSTLQATIHGLAVYIIAMVIFLVLRFTEKKELS